MKQKKRIVAVIDSQTCLECLRYDGCDPEDVGYPPFHEAHESESGECRCVVMDELTIRMRAGGRKIAQGIGVALFAFVFASLSFATFTFGVYCSIRFLEWIGAL